MILRRIPITISAPVLIALPVLIVGTFLSLLWRDNAGSAVRDVADRGTEQIHTLVATRVHSLLSMPVRVCELNEHLIRSGALDHSDPGAWFETMLEQFNDFDMLSTVGWGASDGRAAWVSRYADGNVYWALLDDPDSGIMNEWRLGDDSSRPDEPTNSFGYNLFERPWYRTPVDRGEPSWTEPYLWVGGDGAPTTLGISFGIPVRDDNGSILGIVDADYSLTDLSRFLSTIEIGEHGFLALIDEHGSMIARSGSVRAIDEAGNRRAVSDPEQPILKTASTSLVGDRAQRGRLDPVVVDGETYFLRATEIGHDLGLDWILVTVAAKRDVTGDIERGFQLSFLINILVVLVVTLGAIALARWLVAPLRTLVDSAHRIGSGDLDFEVGINHAPEYTKLANAINTMIIDLRDRMRMRRSLMLAHEVQKNLLPSDEPTIDGLEITGHSTYCDETGGDYYDFLDLSEGDNNDVLVVLGDVMGHGVAAAMLMATARGLLRSRVSSEGSLAEFLEHVNALLIPDTGGQRFMTMLLVTINAQSHRLRWASAGHGPPIVYNANSDTFLDIQGGGLPLGLVEESDYDEYTIDHIDSGHIVLVATDGLWEAKNAQDEQFGEDRLRELLRTHAHKNTDQIKDAIRAAVNEFQGDIAQDDDVTFVVIRVP